MTPTQTQIEAARKLLRNSSCFSDDVCSMLPCKCVEQALTAAAEVGQPYYDGNIDIDRNAPTQAQIEAATTAVMDEIGSQLCAWIDMKTKRACRVNIGQKCLCKQVALAAITAAAEVSEAGIGGPTAEQVNNIVNATIERCAKIVKEWAGFISRREDLVSEIRALKDKP